MEGTVVKGKVVAIEKDFAIIDVGLKTEGRIPLQGIRRRRDGKATLKVGDTVEVYPRARRERAGRSGASAARRPAAKKPGPAWKASSPRTSR